jgi:hypothetical protein
MEQGLPRLLVVERRVQAIRPEPALRPERIIKLRLQVRRLLDLGNEVERGLLPPIDLARGEVFSDVPSIGATSALGVAKIIYWALAAG